MAQFVVHYVDLRFVRRSGYAYARASQRCAADLQAATNVVISEFRTRGPGGGNDEFIELYNPTSSPIDISGWLNLGLQMALVEHQIHDTLFRLELCFNLGSII